MKNTPSLLLAASLAVVMAVSMVITPAAYASWASITDATGDAENPDFDITQVGLTRDGNVRLTVDGNAGGTIPSGEDQDNLVYAYVFVTDAGILAVTSHQAEDSGQVGNDLIWHVHRVTLNATGCVETIEDFGKASVHASHVDVLQSGATIVDAALTVELTIGGGVCVTDLFDATD